MGYPSLPAIAMIPRERFLAALDRKSVDCVPFVETSVAFGISEKLLGRRLVPVSLPASPLMKIRTAEDDKVLSRLIHRDHITYRLLAPTFSENPIATLGQSFVGEGQIKTLDDFRNKFRLPDPEDDRLYEPLKPFVGWREEFAVIFSTRLGFISTVISMGFQTYLEALYLDPELIDAVTGAYVEWYAKVIRRVCAMGVDAVFTADDFAFGSGPFMSPESFRTRVLPYLQRASREISVPWILHTDGNILPIVEDLLAMGIKGIHPIDPNCMDIRSFKKEYGDRVCVLGNVNVDTLTSGTPEKTYGETRDLIRDLAPGYGYVLSSGNSIPEYAQPENVLALARALEDFGAY
jgi:uroporphyrinogen decarboxylase